MAHQRSVQRNLLAIGTFCLSILLAGCGATEPAPVPGERPVEGREFSAEDKRAALALSLGNVSALSADATPYERSLSCSIALEAVYGQLAESGQLDSSMVSAIDQVRTIYDSRVRQLGSAANRSSAEIAADRLERAEEIPEPSERGQIAIGCLRAMA